MTALGWVAFVVAGASGAVARYLVHGWFVERAGGDRPWGTFVVNVSGSFVLGVLTGLALHHGLPETSRVVLGAGFCGAFTTFSAFTVDTVRLVEDGAGRAAVANVVGTLVVGVARGGRGTGPRLALTARGGRHPGGGVGQDRGGGRPAHLPARPAAVDQAGAVEDLQVVDHRLAAHGQVVGQVGGRPGPVAAAAG